MLDLLLFESLVDGWLLLKLESVSLKSSLLYYVLLPKAKPPLKTVGFCLIRVSSSVMNY